MRMTRSEVFEILKNGENSGVEFKRDDIGSVKIARELVAFSNFAGGVLLLGVEDDGSISGLNRDNLEEWVMTIGRDKIRPPIIPFYEIIKEVEPGKDIALIRVARGFDVHTVWHENKNTYYIRAGSQSREPSKEELARMFQQKGNFRAELRPVTGASLADLDPRRLLAYFDQIRQQDTPDEDDKEAWQSLLFNTELSVEDGISVAAILLFGITPNRFLPQAGITAVAYAGLEKDYSTLERTALRGPMTPLLDQKGRIVESGLVEQAVDFVRRNTGFKSQIEASGGRREDIPVYPVEPVREAIINALIHRDYLLSGTDIELSLYADRLEIISPGRLPNGITPERMAVGCRASRNQLIKDVMRDYRYLEHVGMGVPRKIIKGMLAHNGIAPRLIEDSARFSVTLFSRG